MNEHDSTDPMGRVDAIEATLVAMHLPPCPHCQTRQELLPLAGPRWGVVTIHERGCPDRDPDDTDEDDNIG